MTGSHTSNGRNSAFRSDATDPVLASALRGDHGATETLREFGSQLIWKPADRVIAKTLCRLADREEQATLPAVVLELAASGALEDRNVVQRLRKLASFGGNGVGRSEIEEKLVGLRAVDRLREFADDLRKRTKQAGPSEATGLLSQAKSTLEDIDESVHSSESEDGLLLLRRVLEDPELLRPPTAVADRLAWEGRVSLLAGREKLGKSTLVSAAAAAVSAGRPLFDGSSSVHPRTVLYYGLEEHTGDLARRLRKFDAGPDKVGLATEVREAPFAHLRRNVSFHEPALVVVDTLAAFTQHLDLEPGNASDWTRVMSRIGSVARDSEAAMLLLHHARKRDGKYRDSTAIGAGVDMILEMGRGDGPREREIAARGRWALDDFAFRLREDDRLRVELAGEEKALVDRVLACIERNPGASTREVRGRVRGKADDISDALRALEDDGRVRNSGNGSGHEWFVGETSGEESEETAQEPGQNR